MQQPTRLISTPFAQEGEKTEIQNVTGEFDNSATYRLGFPPLTMQSIRSGGKPPKGTDFNGVLFDITENISFLCKGGRYQYNAGLSTLIGGYPEGSNLLLDDNVTEVVSTVAGNQNNPNTNMTGWILKPNKTTAVNVADASGETQQQVNYNGGSKWHSRVGGYKENERAVLANGDIVKSTIDGNTNDPNVDMTGWVNTNDASQVYAESFGIFPNYPTEQTEKIAEAIDYCAEKGLQLNFRAGTYLINTRRVAVGFPRTSMCAFVIRSNMHIVGDGDVVFKVMDGLSTVASPKWYTMFHSEAHTENWSIVGITFDGNAINNQKNSIRYNQAFIGIFANGYSDNVRINYCTFKNNPGENNIICGAPDGAVVTTLGNNWDLNFNRHIDGGLYSSDFTAVFAYANNVKCDYGVYIQTIKPTSFDGAGARNAYEVHGSAQSFSRNYIENYFNAAIVNSNWSQECTDIYMQSNIMVNLFLGGIRLWRQPAAINQTLIKNVYIQDNIINLNNAAYSTVGTYKAGIYGTSNFVLALENVYIERNTVIAETGMQNLSAGVYFLPFTGGSGETFQNFHIRDNKFFGVYEGVNWFSSSGGGATRGLIVENNKCFGLSSVGANTATKAVSIRSASPTVIYDAVVRRNTSNSGQFGLYLDGSILDVTIEDNDLKATTQYNLVGNPTNMIRRGDRLTIQPMPSFPVKEWAIPIRKQYKLSLSYADFASSASATIWILPPKSRIADIVINITQGFTGTATTPNLTVGGSAGNAAYILSTAINVTKQIGTANSQLGTFLTTTPNGSIASWTANSNVIASLSDNNGLITGAMDIYLTVEYL